MKIGLLPSPSSTIAYRLVGIVAVLLNSSAFVATLLYAIRYLQTDPVGVLCGLAQNTAVFSFCYTLIVSFMFSGKLIKGVNRIQEMVKQRKFKNQKKKDERFQLMMMKGKRHGINFSNFRQR